MIAACVRARRALVALAAAGLCAAPAFAQARNCPTVADQLVPVPAGQSVPIKLTVTNLGTTPLTIFQYPSGGMLLPTGPSPLDYVFVPDGTFRGDTSFRYRIVPQEGCDQSQVIGTVTLAGTTAPPTLEVGGVVGVRPVLCGAGFIPLVALTAAWCGAARRRRSGEVATAGRFSSSRVDDGA